MSGQQDRQHWQQIRTLLRILLELVEQSLDLAVVLHDQINNIPGHLTVPPARLAPTSTHTHAATLGPWLGWLGMALGTGGGMLVAKRYRMGPSIGRGGMGEVFRATDEQLGRLVAVKLLLPTDHGVRAAERFHREARAAARVSDAHVVSVYDFGDHDDGFFLVMELVEGRSVAEELAEHGTLPKDRAIDIVEQAAMGLAAAHREDVVHRDVKPGNLLLAADGTVKVADFGIAHLPGEGSTTLTAAGQIIGTTHYLAPEQAKGAQAGKASDVYALGCVLYQLVTGRPPFTADHPAAILYQHVDTPPAPPSANRPELSGSFETVLLQMLAKDPADRPTADEIAAGALRTQAPGHAPWPLVAVPAASALDTKQDVISDGDSAPPNRMRNRSLVAGLIAVIATAAAVTAGVVLNENDKRLPPTTDVGPQPTQSTPGPKPAATRTTSTAGPTQPGTARQSTASTSVQPSQSPSKSGTPSPSTAPTSTTSPTTTSPSTTARSSTTPSDPTPTTSPSSTAPTDAPTTSAPATQSPSPAAQNAGPGSD
ncbi:serine/threonine-protein kinase [Kribbella sp. NPDC026596]|uniref:serine/threonine-protein kinase n=1 Tax=Kribbella sp. NPDC026596 TaxID=3155122 RepID=UPI0033CA7B82